MFHADPQHQTGNVRNVQFNEGGYESVAIHNKTAAAQGGNRDKDDTQMGGEGRIGFVVEGTDKTQGKMPGAEACAVTGWRGLQ